MPTITHMHSEKRGNRVQQNEHDGTDTTQLQHNKPQGNNNKPQDRQSRTSEDNNTHNDLLNKTTNIRKTIGPVTRTRSSHMIRRPDKFNL